jgi:hypothetical protein
MYVHPWDVADEGADSVLERITSTGIKAVNLATSYHSGRYLLQHNPKKKVYFAEEGVVYFAPDPAYFRKCVLKPRRSTEYRDVDVLAMLLKEAKRFGTTVNSWTVTLHNSAFGRSHPELAVEDAFGGVNYNVLCPNNPEVRKYHSALVRSLLDYDLNAIQLESSSFPAAMPHGDHHEMFGAQVEPLVSELMTVCFCEHCTRSAKGQDLDLAKSRKLVREIIETSFDLPPTVLKSTSFSETLRTSYVISTDIEEIRKIQTFQRETVGELFSEARKTIRDAGSRTRLNVIAFGGVSGESFFGRGTEGISLHKLGKIVDGIDLIVYVSEPEVAYYLIKWSKFDAGSCPIYAAFRPSYPVLFSREAVAASVSNAFEAGASGVAFYNYGWTPLRNFEWIKHSLQ